ncbi:MAG TPA: helix-turn-helix domain-containing protein [Ramlibacter sp.]|nr:helix-turn-helix domain-containing protein [Ramlibacter sp.]
MADRLFLRLAEDPLYAPETTVPAGTMREFAVPPALAPWVANAMGYEDELAPGVEATERVLPDGALRLIFDFDGDAVAARVVGASTRAVVLTHRGEMRGLSLTLRPGAAQALFGVPAHELAEGAHAWDDVVRSPVRGIGHRMLEAGSPQARMAVVLQVLQEALQAPDAADRARVASAMHVLQHSRSGRPVVEAAEAVGLGERRLQQLFGAHVGLSPKAWHGLARFHDCVRLLRGRRVVSWAEVAAEAGFHDQAHLANTFRAICGCTPGQFLAERAAAGFSKTSA